MELNPEIRETLKEYRINKDVGLLALLGIYFKLDIEKVCDEETIKAINLTKIVEKDYGSNTLKWNIPLFVGQQTEWDWVAKYNDLWDRNKSRKDNTSDVTKRMQEFFKKYPEYRKQDVQIAAQAYHAQQKDPQYLKSSAKFIFEGMGGSKTSQLLTWIINTRGKDGNKSGMKGKLM